MTLVKSSIPRLPYMFSGSFSNAFALITPQFPKTVLPPDTLLYVFFYLMLWSSTIASQRSLSLFHSNKVKGSVKLEWRYMPCHILNASLTRGLQQGDFHIMLMFHCVRLAPSVVKLHAASCS